MLINIIVIISAVLNTIAKFVRSYETLIAGRFMTGIFSGLFSGVLPLYLLEIAPINLRGIAGTMGQLNLVIGILITNILGLDILLGTKNLWPFLVGLVIVPSFVHLGLFAAVESPKYLFLIKNDKEAAQKGFV